MAKKKTSENGAIEIVPGTEEHAAREFFANEKAAYEERTGEKVHYELAHPLTSTPLPKPAEPASDEKTAEGEANN